MDQNEDDSFLTALESVEKKNKPKSKQKATKEKKEKLISVKTIGEYKNNEIAVNINKFLSTNIDPDAGNVLFGENLARAGEYYGLKSTPVFGLIISTIGLVVVIFRVMMKKKKTQDKNNTAGIGDLNKL